MQVCIGGTQNSSLNERVLCNFSRIFQRKSQGKEKELIIQREYLFINIKEYLKVLCIMDNEI